MPISRSSQWMYGVRWYSTGTSSIIGSVGTRIAVVIREFRGRLAEEMTACGHVTNRGHASRGGNEGLSRNGALSRAVAYIEQNPISAGLVCSAPGGRRHRLPHQI